MSSLADTDHFHNIEADTEGNTLEFHAVPPPRVLLRAVDSTRFLI